MNEAPDRTSASGSARVPDRRTFLKGAVAGSVIGFAGCSGLVGSRHSELTVDVDGRAWVTSFDGRLDDRRLGQPSGLLAAFAQDVGFAVNPVSRESTFVLCEDYEATTSHVSITLKPDLSWSNGDPLTAADVGRWAYMFRAGRPGLAPVPAIRSGERQPSSSWAAVTSVEWDDRTVTLRGRFDIVPAPLFELNSLVGSRPRTYYGELWEEFVDAFDEQPWEDAAARERVTEIVEDHLRTVGDDRLPDAGIRLEDAYDGSGWEAAYSGLWYPYRTNANHLHFTVNESHPFADRVSHDELVWAFRDEPDATLYDLRSGSIDGAMLDDVSESATKSVPPAVDSFDGPASGGIALRFNHSTRRLGDRNVRAAIAHAVDRERLAEATVAAGDRPVSVPGADLQHDRWAPSAFRDGLRSYSRDLDRARALLERAGFRRTGERWFTPDGNRFEFVVLTDDPDPAVEISIAEQLRSFGIDASMRRVESTSYQQRLGTGQFAATTSEWSSPNATGLPRVRGGEYARSALDAVALPESAFLASAIDDAVRSADGLRWTSDETVDSDDARRLAFDSVDALRAVTVEAPPLGEVDGDTQEWPYLYHAVRATTAEDVSEAIEHAGACTWVYNYQLPRLELVVDVPRIFHDTEEWSVPPTDDVRWQYARRGTQAGGLWAALGWGHVGVE